MDDTFEMLLQKWVGEKVVLEESAKKMRTDWNAQKAEQAGNRWTIAISTIGALLLGIAAISFVAVNWETLHRFTKIALFVCATFASFGGGVFLQEIQKEYPKTGASLLFLSALLFGGTLALVSQVYQLGGDAWTLLALWTAGILPIAYLFSSLAVLRLALFTGISALLLYLSGGDSLGIEDLFGSLFESFSQFPTLLIVGTLFFALGSIHLLTDRFAAMGKVLRLLGIKIFLFFLFWLSFLDISKEIFDEMNNVISNSDAFFWKNLFLATLSAAMGSYFFLQKSRPLSEVFGFILALITGVCALLVFDYGAFFLFTIWANILFIFTIGALLKEGYQARNLEAVNFATFGIGIFLFGKYIDLFFDVFDTTLFFFVGGIVLVAGGIFLERKRRVITASFSAV